MSKAREAFDIFTSIVCDGSYANLALKEQDDRFIRSLIYTTLEHLSHIDYILSFYAKGRVNTKIRNILRLGACQILFMTRPDSAVCNECTTLTKEIGKAALSGFVNAVLRSIARDKDAGKLPQLPEDAAERLHIISGYPEWLVIEYIERFGEDEAIKALTFTDDTVSIRPQYPYTADELESFLNESNVEYRRGKLDSEIFHVKGNGLTRHELFTSGRITIQSESSAIVCRCCGDVSGKSILDACSAPGGKSAYLYSLAKGACDITACELHEHREALIKETFSRLNVKAKTICADMTQHITEFEKTFDVVLCDVPCSGLGVIGKPDARYRRDAESVEDIAKTQAAILKSCADYVKDGGKLVYSTCTVSRRENEDTIAAFLKCNTDFAPAADLAELPESVRDRARDGCLHILPHTDGTDGFFIAILARKERK